jgi:hypothetical protein
MSAAIHLTAGRAHLSEWWLLAALFVAAAVLQAAWTTRVWRHDSTPLLLAGVALNLGIALVWALSRTRGLPIGPDRFEPEGIGLLDLQSTVDEVLVCVLALSAVSPLRRLGSRLAYGVELASLAAVATSFLALASGAGHHA